MQELDSQRGEGAYFRGYTVYLHSNWSRLSIDKDIAHSNILVMIKCKKSRNELLLRALRVSMIHSVQVRVD